MLLLCSLFGTVYILILLLYLMYNVSIKHTIKIAK